MRPFDEALIDAILEAYGEGPRSPPKSDPKRTSTQGSIQDKRDDRNAAMGMENVSLWLDREERYIYLRPKSGTRQYFFRDPAGRDMWLHALLKSGYTLKD